ncbi:helix-turn-helix domain-containing protein [Microbacterium sp. A8/3-1]|uniref:Helix-turn-helix domain-containing protein n=1 Tax=Microbacterium sp. A8/3-1 TaxID=3160749 RepID=A0AAU7VW13_9MICO
METAQTADYALSILLALEERPDQTISELAVSLDLSRSVAQRIVVTLHNRAFVIRGRDARYSLGPALIEISASLPHQLAIAARPYLKDLAQSTGEMIVLAVPEGDEAVVIARRSGNSSPVRVEYEVGFRHPLWQGASGVSILANLDTVRRRKLGSPAGQIDVEAIRAQGFARTSGQLREHMEGLAVPIMSEREGVVGSIAVVAPTVRSSDLDDHVVALREAATATSADYEAERSFSRRAEAQVSRA